ncbi:hypothetical protein CAPTEDRAFT_93687, partial [Capitella teleta]
ASGVQVKDECKVAFKDIKLKKKNRYIIFRITSDLKCIEIEKMADEHATYEDFVEDLKVAQRAGECRYGLFDAKYQKAGSMDTKSSSFSYG